jgi:hypothetical protein
MRHRLFGIKVEPSLATLLSSSGIPCDTKTLEPAAGKRHKVLLQREYPKGVGEFKIPQLTIRRVGMNVKCAVLFIERGSYAILGEAGVVEIAEDRLLTGWLHCEGVMGITPFFRLLGMAPSTRHFADISGR